MRITANVKEAVIYAYHTMEDNSYLAVSLAVGISQTTVDKILQEYIEFKTITMKSKLCRVTFWEENDTEE